MPNNTQNPAAARARILAESFPGVTLDQAAVLVGILFAYRFVLSADMGNPQTQVARQQSVELLPLDPQAAAALVADVFTMDPERVLSNFQENWATLKHRNVFKELMAELRSHPAVADLREHTRWV